MAKATLTLRAKIFDSGVRKKTLQQVIIKSGEELAGEQKELMTNSQPSGKTYRRGRITQALSKRNKNLGLRTFETKKGNKRAIVGFKFHRASRKGEPPAIDKGILRNSIKFKLVSDLKGQVSVGAKYGDVLDDPTKLNRPFFRKTVKNFQPKFQKNLDEVIQELLK